MPEHIERETAIKELMNDAPEQVGYSREDAADCIRYMDAADVAPVRHGRWVYSDWWKGNCMNRLEDAVCRLCEYKHQAVFATKEEKHTPNLLHNF